MVVQETRGQPDGLLVCHLPLGPTAYFTLSNVVMRHDIEDRATVSEAYPHLILEDFESPLGRRVADILKHVFPVPKADSRRVVTFANEDDCIRFRHHTFEKAAGKKEVVLKVGVSRGWLGCVGKRDGGFREVTVTSHVQVGLHKAIPFISFFLNSLTKCAQEVGPRFDMMLFQVKLGTMDQGDAETEYVLRPFMNTAKKRRML